MKIKAIIFDLDGTLRDTREVTHPILYEGAQDVLRLLKGQYKLAIVSSATDPQSYLEEQGLAEYFDVIIGVNDTAEHEPSPEPVRLALKQLEVKPGQAVMVGDLPADVRAAKAARVAKVIGISHGFADAEALRDAGADEIINSLRDLEVVFGFRTQPIDHKTIEEYVLSMPNSYLDYPFGKDVAVYKTGPRGDGKMFALIPEGGDPARISLKCDPLLATTLRERYETVMPGYHLNKKHWNTIILSGQLPLEEVKALVLLSYELVLNS